jgi:hypothetical protein
MSLRKFCSATLPDAHPMHCPGSPQCDHHWFYDFRVNRRRYRNTTETANKQEAKKFEAKERSRILEGRQQIRALPDITFAQFTVTYLREYADLHKRSVERDREIRRPLTGPSDLSSCTRSRRSASNSTSASGSPGSGASITARAHRSRLSPPR